MTEPVRTQVEGQYGLLQINGKRYETDVILHTDGQVSNRNCSCSPSLRIQLSPGYRDDYFHTPLSEYELGFLQEERPEVVIVGAGFRCMMLLTPRAKDILANYEHHVLSTQRAIDLANKENRRFVAIFHLTC